LSGLIVDYELLKDANNILLVERDALRDQVADLDSELVIAKASAIEDIAALEAKDAALEAHAADEALAGETHLVNFEAKFVRDLADWCVTYMRNIQSIMGMCLPIYEGDPSAADYVHWLGAEVASLPEVFAGVNENIVSATIEGMLVMAEDYWFSCTADFSH
jgi:hypothetical protein